MARRAPMWPSVKRAAPTRRSCASPASTWGGRWRCASSAISKAPSSSRPARRPPRSVRACTCPRRRSSTIRRLASRILRTSASARTRPGWPKARASRRRRLPAQPATTRTARWPKPAATPSTTPAARATPRPRWHRLSPKPSKRSTRPRRRAGRATCRRRVRPTSLTSPLPTTGFGSACLPCARRWRRRCDATRKKARP